MQDTIGSVFLGCTTAVSMEVLKEAGMAAHIGAFGEELFPVPSLITKTITTVVSIRISVKYILLLFVQQ